MRIAAGFHLIEIMIVIAIISILSTFISTNYFHYLVNERRLEAIQTLTRLANAMEEFHLQNNSYQGASVNLLQFPEWIAKQHYQLFIRSANDFAYLLEAKPSRSQENADDCGSLFLNEKNEKSISGKNKIDECWH